MGRAGKAGVPARPFTALANGVGLWDGLHRCGGHRAGLWEGVHRYGECRGGLWGAFTAAERLQYTYWDSSHHVLVKEFRDGYPGNDTQRQVFHDAGVPPIDLFGHPYLMSDPTYPDEQGQQLIAERLEAAVLANEKVRQFLAAPAPN